MMPPVFVVLVGEPHGCTTYEVARVERPWIKLPGQTSFYLPSGGIGRS
jgi:hypothetical protein